MWWLGRALWSMLLRSGAMSISVRFQLRGLSLINQDWVLVWILIRFSFFRRLNPTSVELLKKFYGTLSIILRKLCRTIPVYHVVRLFRIYFKIFKDWIRISPYIYYLSLYFNKSLQVTALRAFNFFFYFFVLSTGLQSYLSICTCR